MRIAETDLYEKSNGAPHQSSDVWLVLNKGVDNGCKPMDCQDYALEFR
jgi:hypothetical protein